jgi:tetratricopeptide (TPR) repeat protein
MRRVAAAGAVVWALCGAAGIAAAQAAPEEVTAQVEELSAEGSQLFRQGRYREAIAVFERAYNLAQVANLLYNIGLSYERLGERQAAINYYERFIVARDADPEVRSRALERVRELEKLNQPPPPDPVVGPVKEEEPPPRPEPSRALTTTGIIVGGAGVLATGTGVVFGFLAQGEQESFDASRDLYTKQVARTNAENRALTADVLYGLGGAAILAGVTLILIDQLSDQEAAPEEQVRISPSLGAQGAGVQVEWRFGQDW